MMGEYVRKQDVIEYFMTNIVWHDEDGYPIEDADEKRSILTELVDGLTPVDVRPITHGKWIPVTLIRERPQLWADATEPDEIDALKCSECGEIFDFTEARNWCPECGSCMKGKER